MTTPVVENTQKPSYMMKFQFPVFMPVLNDKIIIRCWDKRKALSDIFIGNIPEMPLENDYFNINSLQSKGGNMPYRWVISFYIDYSINIYYLDKYVRYTRR